MTSDSNVIARRYVSAFFALADEQKKHENVKKDLIALQEVIAKSPELQKFLTNPVITRKQAGSAMNAVLAALKACDLTQQFFARIADNRRLALTSLIIDMYLERLAASKGELAVQVISLRRLIRLRQTCWQRRLPKLLARKLGSSCPKTLHLLAGFRCASVARCSMTL